MGRIVLSVSVAALVACGGSKRESQAPDSGPPFLEDLTVTEASPIAVKCSDGLGTRMEFEYAKKETFRANYSGLKQAFENRTKYTSDSGAVSNVDLVETCDVTQNGQSLETWRRK